MKAPVSLQLPLQHPLLVTDHLENPWENQSILKCSAGLILHRWWGYLLISVASVCQVPDEHKLLDSSPCPHLSRCNLILKHQGLPSLGCTVHFLPDISQKCTHGHFSPTVISSCQDFLLHSQCSVPFLQSAEAADFLVLSSFMIVASWGSSSHQWRCLGTERVLKWRGLPL